MGEVKEEINPPFKKKIVKKTITKTKKER